MTRQRELFRSPDSDYFTLFCDALGVRPEPGWPDAFGQQIQSWASREVAGRGIRTLSLFSGAGGLDIGFHDAGFGIRDLVEIDERFCRTLQANSGTNQYLGSCRIHCMDIAAFNPDASELGHFDFILGGPPCQSFSAAARRASGVTGVNDSRGRLFVEYVRLLRILKPKAFLFENVYGITGANSGRAWSRIVAAFADAGYSVFHRLLDAADYGVPQHRERMFIVGVREGVFRFPRPTHGPDSGACRSYYTAGNAVKGVALSAGELSATVNGRYSGLLERIPPGLNYSFFTEKMGHPEPVFAWRSKFSDFLYKADPDTPIRTLKAQGGQYTGPFHWDSRPFAVNELKRLQTFPDGYRIVGGRQVATHQIGNSVPPQLARMLSLAILDQAFNVCLPSPIEYLEPNERLGFRKRKRLLTGVYRRKAHAALVESEGIPVKPPRSRRYAHTLSSDFGWNRIGDGHPVHVSFQPSREVWTITASDSRQELQLQTPWAFRIVVRPVESWGIPSERVELRSSDYSDWLFTALWKAFESELIRNRLKADLVQLCGYYTYEPAFTIRFEPNSPPPASKWSIVSRVCEGRGVRSLLSSDELAEIWQVPRGSVLSTAQQLRRLGYEVRNPLTNPEIPPESYLVPYAFPTLTPKSVQLRKSLV